MMACLSWLIFLTIGELEYADEDEYHTPPVGAVVTELVPIEEVMEESFLLSNDGPQGLSTPLIVS
jgi:hypothetical protein